MPVRRTSLANRCLDIGLIRLIGKKAVIDLPPAYNADQLVAEDLPAFVQLGIKLELATNEKTANKATHSHLP